MFEHSVKVPRHYKIAANIFKKVSTEGGSVKTLLYDEKLRHFRTNVLFALITETIKHAADIDKIFENSMLLQNEPRLDQWLAKVLTAELLFGKKVLPGKSKPEQTVLSYKEKFEQYMSAHQDELKIQEIPRPRYVRINTNLLTTSDAIGAFQEEGYRFIRCTSGTYEDYLLQIQNLTEYDFTQDYHVKTVFVFAPGTKFHDHDLYLENKIILQDKATAMAVHLLAPPPGSAILDMCAAPGMKTTQLAAYIRNNGRIYAVERNEKRYQTLCDFVKKTKSECVDAIHKDALEIRRGELEDVEYILLDPSCSGSGMDFCVHNYIEDSRLAKLTSLQEKFLKHAMNAFPKAKRIVYSTCSIYPEENERVITNVVKTSRAKWRVQDVKELLKGKWNNFGSAMYGSMGTRCMYAKPDSDLTTGFFLAVLDRDPKDLEKSDLRIENDKKERQKQKSVEAVVATDDDCSILFSKKSNKKKEDNDLEETRNTDHNRIDNENGTAEDVTKKQKKNKKSKNEKEEVKTLVENFEVLKVDQENEEKVKKRRKHKVNEEDSLNDIGNMSIIVEDIEVPKKKKKKHKDLENSQLVEIVVEESEVKSKKKKRSRGKSENIDTEMVIEDVSEIPKKKKKKKDIP